MTFIPASQMDPDASITVPVVDVKNANRKPSTRWGRVQFDAAGVGEVTVKVADLTTLVSLNWLPCEVLDQLFPPDPVVEKKALPMTSPDEVNSMLAQLGALQMELSALQATHADTNALLHEKVDEVSALRIALEERNALVQTQENVLAEKVKLIASLEAQLEEAHATKPAPKKSKS